MMFREIERSMELNAEFKKFIKNNVRGGEKKMGGKAKMKEMKDQWQHMITFFFCCE